MLSATLTGTPAPMFGDGRQEREFTCVDDIVAATRAPQSNVAINVGGGESASMLNDVDHIARLTGRHVPVVAAARRGRPVTRWPPGPT